MVQSAIPPARNLANQKKVHVEDLKMTRKTTTLSTTSRCVDDEILVVTRLLLHQRVVRALLHHRALRQHHDLVDFCVMKFFVLFFLSTSLLIVPLRGEQH